MMHIDQHLISYCCQLQFIVVYKCAIKRNSISPAKKKHISLYRRLLCNIYIYVFFVIYLQQCYFSIHHIS